MNLAQLSLKLNATHVKAEPLNHTPDSKHVRHHDAKVSRDAQLISQQP